MVKFWLYSSASLLACAGLLWYTYITRQQFYPSVIYLVTSKISVLILGNAGLVITILLGRLVKSIFLGTLRDAEVELLHENVRYAITETCLALTIFRDEINFQVVVLFTSLVFLKIFHWLSQCRIEFIEQSDFISRLTHMRLVSLMAVLVAVDMTFVVICGMKVLEAGASVFILFGFEFLILLVTLVAIFLRYVLYVIDSRMDGTWNNKFTYLFYLELVSEIIKLLIYLVFFMLIFTYYGMPLHIVRDLWVSIKNLQRRVASYFRYRKITANLNERFPNPTEEELQETDRTCIICREEMISVTCKKLPCSHIFHVDCLKMWVQRQQTCPTCRSTIPTGPRPPVVPETPAQPAPVAPAVPVPNQPAHPAAVPFRLGIPGMGAVPPVQPAANAPTLPVNGQQGAPPASGVDALQRGSIPTGQPGIAPVPPNAGPHGAPYHPLGPGYPSPFMSPLIFGPGMGVPFGYGLPGAYGMVPPFGVPLGHGAHPLQPGANAATIDPENIQRQIDHLRAQLAMLQAAALQQGVPQHVMVPPPPSSTPPVTSTMPSVPASQQAESPVPTTNAIDEMEEKAPTPISAQQNSSVSNASEEPASVTSVDRLVPPPAVTEADRRREELRRRYNRIYANTGSSNHDSDSTEEKKSD